jgi:hypothetical protein
MVYDLYGLTEEEVRIVEEGGKEFPRLPLAPAAAGCILPPE